MATIFDEQRTLPQYRSAPPPPGLANFLVRKRIVRDLNQANKVLLCITLGCILTSIIVYLSSHNTTRSSREKIDPIFNQLPPDIQKTLRR